jgi:Family of unknown function (DUF6069)
MSDPTRPLGQPYRQTPAARPSVDATRLWVGGLLAGVVAAGVAIVGLLIARGIFDIRVFVPGRDDALFTPSSWWYAGAAFMGGVLATGLLHLLLVANAPAPFRFFSWIVGLVIAISVIVPFTTNTELESQIATAAINLAIGLTLISILQGVGHSAVRNQSWG